MSVAGHAAALVLLTGPSSLERVAVTAGPARSAGALEVSVVAVPPRPPQPSSVGDAGSEPRAQPARPEAPSRWSAPRPAAPGASAVIPSAPAADPRLLAMRRPALDLTVPPSFGQADETAPAATPPAVRPLEPAAGGAAVVHDGVATLHVAPDGRAHLVDAPNLNVQLIRPTLRGAGKMLLDWYKDPYAQTRAGPAQELPAYARAFDPSVAAVRDVPPAANPTAGKVATGVAVALLVPRAVGTMDVTDWLMRAAKVGDPYAARKLKLLDETRDERVELGRRHELEELDGASELMRRNLVRLAAASLEPAARREALFQLWDECAEGDDARGEAGARARAMVVGWIRGHLPRGSAGAFSDEDIAAFDRRRTAREPFRPYPTAEP